jgi:FkbM family methyltransferase
MWFKLSKKDSFTDFTFGEGVSKVGLINIKDDPITLATKNGHSDFEKFSIQVWSKLCSHESTRGIIWDVGAFIGVYGLIAAKASPDNRVYCFEPSSAPFYRLLAHIQLNQMWSQVFPLKIALSDQNLKMQLHHPFGWFVLGSGDNLSDIYSTSYFRENVDLEIADELLFENHFYELDFTNQVPQIGLPSLVKVDIEGHEVNFLRGATKTIALGKPVVLIEILSSIHLELVSQELKEFKWISIIESSNTFSSSPNFEIQGSNNFIFCHSDKISEVSSILSISDEIMWN